MNDHDFKDLMEAAEEMVAIERGDAVPARESRYEGKVLVEVREEGRVVWSLDEAEAPAGADAATVRAALRQSQEGMAELLGVSLRTVQNWEQGRRTPRGPAETLLRVAGCHPAAVFAATARRRR